MSSMTASNSSSVYKILASSPPQPFPSELPLSELDRESGFIHLCGVDQLSSTLSRFFSTAEHVWILKLSVQELVDRGGTVRWEISEPNGNAFPHLYDLRLGASDVKVIEKLTRPSEDTWEDIVKRHPL